MTSIQAASDETLTECRRDFRRAAIATNTAEAAFIFGSAVALMAGVKPTWWQVVGWLMFAGSGALAALTTSGALRAVKEEQAARAKWEPPQP